MHKRKGEVFLIEDDRTQMRTLSLALENSGFEVWPSSRVDEAKKLIEKTGVTFDVAILDMLLEDPKRPHVSGGDIGKLLRARQTNSPPEFLIYTAYDRPRYYRQALELGASGYLNKLENTHRDVVRHAVTLTIRRRLRHPNVVAELEESLNHCRTEADAIKIFASRILKKHFLEVLNNPFLLLVTETLSNGVEETLAFGSLDLASDTAGAFEVISGLAFSSFEQSHSLVVRRSSLAGLVSAEETALLDDLEGSVFVPFSQSANVKLALGILPAKTGDTDVLKLALLLRQHLQSILVHRLVAMWDILAHRDATLSSLGQVCLNIGQKQLELIKTAQVNREYELPSPALERLAELTHQLTQTGESLAALSQAKPHLPGGAVRRLCPVEDTVRRVWGDLLPLGEDHVAWVRALDLQGSCQAAMDGEDLYVIVAGILRWLLRKGRPLSQSGGPFVWVRCLSQDRACEVRFEDANVPLPNQLSHSLFEPFSFMQHGGTGLELFALRTMIQVRYRGTVQHEGYQSSDRMGNRILLRLPCTDATPWLERVEWTTA